MSLASFFYCYRDHRDLHSFPTRRSSDLSVVDSLAGRPTAMAGHHGDFIEADAVHPIFLNARDRVIEYRVDGIRDRKSTRLNSSHANISYAVFCLKKKTQTE